MTISEKLFERACKHIPGGVNSPVRAFDAVGTTPVYIESGCGSRILSVDGKEYIDFCGSWGPLILGHSNQEVLRAVQDTAEKGLSFGSCNPLEVEFAELFCELIPHVDMLRLVNSGTEAVMTALRLARGFTNRTNIVKFDGCYHGHSDCLLVSAGSGLLTNSISSSKGVTDKAVSEVITSPYNDIEKLEKIFAEQGDTIAAVIVEPVAGNMGLVMPKKGFLEALRKICTQYGACLIFDETITGFRFHCGAYSEIAGITPDISTFGKIIGGGMPIGAIAAGKEIMELLAPLGEVYQAGTLSGNPVAAAAGIATLRTLKATNPYSKLSELASLFGDKINTYAQENKLAVHCKTYGGTFTLFFTAQDEINNLEDVKNCDTELFAAYYRYMLDKGIYMSPSQFELNFVSAAHSRQDVETAADAVIEFLSTRIKL
ncbi:MAG: glutamate-1-semialdehyde 2,1-aminomutase [Victivallales bacterium]|nr:glutamate-1-semialdehyde 2,1-aminomutase [Victivallales bacterium]